MKISIPAFRGEMPKVSSRLLSEGFAENATNCRLLSGDLTPWKQPTSVVTLTPASVIRSVYKMQTLNGGNNVYLRSVDDVDWIKGAVAGDSTERIYFTGFRDDPSGSATPAKPKVTNFTMATGGTIHTGQTSGNYPNNWLSIGVPAPSTAPAGTSVAIHSGSSTTFSNGDSAGPSPGGLSMWTTNGTVTAGDPGMGGACIKLTDQADIHSASDPGGPGEQGESLSFDFRIDGENRYFDIRFACDSLGEGPIIRLATGVQTTETEPGAPTFYHQDPGSLSIGTATTWTAVPTFTSSATVGAGGRSTVGFSSLPATLLQDTNYSMSLTVTLDSEGIYRVNIVIGSLYSGTFQFTPEGNFFGFRTDPVNSSVNAFVDNVVLSNNLATDDATSTSYVYTWVNELGEEGPPSLASNVVQLSSGLTTTITGIADPSGSQVTEYGLTQGDGVTDFGTKRLYRATTDSAGTTQFLFVTDINYGTTSYIDTTTNSVLGEAIESTDWLGPPTDGHSILALPNGITVMASKNEVYPSVQNRPHAYPRDYVLATDFDIVGMAALDTTVVVLTKSNPYLVLGSDPSSLSMSKLELPQGCVSKRSIASLAGFGVIYASPDGLVAINGNGVQLVTQNYFTREQWQALVPSSIFAKVHDDKYFFAYDTGSTKGIYIFDPKEGGTLTKVDLSGIGGFNNAITAGYSDPLTDTFYLVHSNDKLVTWNSSGTSLSYTWRSKVYQLPYAVNMLAGQIKGSTFGGGLTFNVVGDGATYFTKNITASGEFVLGLPTFGTNELQIELVGTATVKTAEIAETMEELA